MKSVISSLGIVVLVLLVADGRGVSQSASRSLVNQYYSAWDPSPTLFRLSSSSSVRDSVPTSRDARGGSSPVVYKQESYRPFSKIGFDVHVGVNGAGFEVATPLARAFNIRVGADFFSYSTTFQEQGADVAADLRLRSGRGSLDWFPFGGGFRLSPVIVFANNTRGQGTALIPAGSTITLSGQDYISSSTDPLHGGGSIDFRRVSPGFTVGYGNIIPRTRKHFSVPVELGFYYVGQPGLKVFFTGSACDPTVPQAIGCESVNQDADFQQSLAQFIARNNNNLKYASFFPIASVGFGYSF